MATLTTTRRRGRPAKPGLRIRGTFVVRGREAERISKGAAASAMPEGAYTLALALAYLNQHADQNPPIRKEIDALRAEIEALRAALEALLPHLKKSP